MSGVDGTGDATEVGDEVEVVGIGVAVGLALRDGLGELVSVGLLEFVGVTVGAYVDGVTVAGLVLVPVGVELAGAGSGLTQR